MEIVEKLRATEMRETGQELGGIPITKLTQINPDGPEAADEIERLREALQSIKKVPNSEAAYGIIQVFVDDALKEKE
jgi:hypothetical protein